MTFSQFKSKEIAKTLAGIFKFLAERLFLTALILIFISMLFGAAVFYKYNILPQKIEPELGEVIKFDKDSYQKFIGLWQNRGERFEAAKTKKYPDPFK